MTTGTECSTLGGVQKKTKESMNKNENEQMKRTKKILYIQPRYDDIKWIFSTILLYIHTHLKRQKKLFIFIY